MISGKNTPIARATRTLIAALAGVAATAMTFDFVADARLSTIQLILLLIAAFVSAGVAFAQAHADALPTATTAVGKAVATFFQIFGPGLAAVGITELTTDALSNAGVTILRAAIAAAFAAGATFLQNSSEDGAAV